RHGPQARDPDEPRFRHRDRRRGGLCRGHLQHHPARPAHGRGTRLPHQAARRGRAHRDRHRAARASDHGAEILQRRAGHGGHERGHHRRRRRARTHPDRPGRRRRRHRVRGCGRHRRRGERRAAPALWPARGAARKAPARADAAPRGRLLHPPHGPRPHRRRGRCRDPHGGRGHLAREHPAAPVRDCGPQGPAWKIRRPGAACVDHLRGDRSRDPGRARQDRRRRAPGRAAPGHPDRARI
ncbi:MAG: Homoserine dehydrogenase, partial [uncultured Microvirga sp.]